MQKANLKNSNNYLTLLGYNTLVFFDDNLYNLEMAKQLEDLYQSIKIITVHAKIN